MKEYICKYFKNLGLMKSTKFNKNDTINQIKYRRPKL